jgi:peptidoglycan-N-acetylglucosamine deacetylase
MIGSVLAGIGCAAAAASTYFLPQAGRYSNARALRNATAKTRSLVLTYDDGPGVSSTPALLSLLNTRAAKATFFLVGRQAQAHPEIVDNIRAAGHEIGCHSFAHHHAWKVPPWTALRDIKGGYAALARWLPADGIYRPPYGKISLATWLSLRRRHARTVLWTADCGDTHAVLPPADAVIEEVHKAGGGVILLHDFDRATERVDYVLQVTGALLDLAQREGMTVRKLGELCPKQ